MLPASLERLHHSKELKPETLHPLIQLVRAASGTAEIHPQTNENGVLVGLVVKTPNNIYRSGQGDLKLLGVIPLHEVPLLPEQAELLATISDRFVKLQARIEEVRKNLGATIKWQDGAISTWLLTRPADAGEIVKRENAFHELERCAHDLGDLLNQLTTKTTEIEVEIYNAAARSSDYNDILDRRLINRVQELFSDFDSTAALIENKIRDATWKSFAPLWDAKTDK